MAASPLARLLTGTVVALALAIPAITTRASAQVGPVNVTFTGSATGATAFPFVRDGTTYTYYVGPNTGTLSLLSTDRHPSITLGVQLFCVDFFDHIKAGDTYTANLSSLTDQGTLRYARNPGGLSAYRKAAFLADQFAGFTQAGDRDAKFGAIQGAIWRIMGASSATLKDPAGATGENQISYWTDLATTFAASPQYATYDYSRYAIVTDTRVGDEEDGRMRDDDQNYSRYADGYKQEFLATRAPTTTTPEPASLALVGVGLTSLAGAAIRRRRGAAA